MEKRRLRTKIEPIEGEPLEVARKRILEIVAQDLKDEYYRRMMSPIQRAKRTDSVFGRID